MVDHLWDLLKAVAQQLYLWVVVMLLIQSNGQILFFQLKQRIQINMTTYKDIHGTKVEVRDDDPANPVNGQVWYNSGTLKGHKVSTVGAWATGSNLNTARQQLAGAGVSNTAALAFGGIFALSGAIGGIFGQNFGAGQINRLVSTYRDALVFCLIYTLCMWGIFYTMTSYIVASFRLQRDGTDILNAFTSVGVGSYIFIGALFVSNAAFNNLGKPRRSAVLNWIKDGVLSCPLAIWLSASFGAVGVIYGQAVAGIMMGAFAALWGWRYVSALTAADMAITQK